VAERSGMKSPRPALALLFGLSCLVGGGSLAVADDEESGRKDSGFKELELFAPSRRRTTR